MEIKPTGLAWNLPPSQRPFRPVPAISPTPVSVPLPFIVIAHGAMGARPRGDGRSPMGRWALAHGAVGVRPWGGGRRESQEQGRKSRAWKRESRA